MNVFDRCPLMHCRSFVHEQPDSSGFITCSQCDHRFVALVLDPKEIWATLPSRLRHKIEHALGYEKLYRNHYCAPIGGEDEVEWQHLANANLARSGQIFGGLHTWYVTEVGVALYKCAKELA